MRLEIQQAITRAAREAGVDPAYALAVAERESAGDPNARSSKSIYGLYQMTGGLRKQYGSGSSADPYTQAKAWTAFIKDTKAQMAAKLGRPVTDAEAYLGHHFSAARAARGLRDDPSAPVTDYFSSYERSINPHFDKAGTIGRLNSAVIADINRRQARYGGAELPDLSKYGTPVSFMNKTMPDQAAGMRAVDGAYTRSMEADQQNPGGARNNEITPETFMDLRVGPKVQPDQQLDPMERQNIPDLSKYGRRVENMPTQAVAYAPPARVALLPAVEAINSAAPMIPSSPSVPPVTPVTPPQEPLRASSPADLESA